MKKKLLPLLLLFAMVIAGCSGGAGTAGNAGAPEQEAKQYAVGEMGVGENFNITLQSVESAYDVVSGALSYTAEDGNVYLLLGLKLENTTRKEHQAETWNAVFEVDGSNVKNTIMGPELEIQGKTYERMSTETVLASGESAEVYIAAEIPENWKNCEFTYDGVTFVISIEDAPLPPPTPEYQVGEAAQTENFNVTLVMGESMKEVQEYSTSSIYMYSEAGEGNTILVLLFDIENTTSEAQELFERGNFELTVDGEECPLTWITLSNISLNDTAYESFIKSMYVGYELESGGHEVKYIAAEIPEDWSHFEITFDGAIFKGDSSGADVGEGDGGNVVEDDTEGVAE